MLSLSSRLHAYLYDDDHALPQNVRAIHNETKASEYVQVTVNQHFYYRAPESFPISYALGRWRNWAKYLAILPVRDLIS
jgi:hypothetical protein